MRNPDALAAAKAQAYQSHQSNQPRAQNAPARLGSGTPSLEALTSFPGMGLEAQVADMGRDQVSGPASTQIAASQSQVVEVVNANLSVWTKSGARLGTQDLALLFSLPSGYVFADPSILFDPSAGSNGRWFLTGSSYNANYDSNVYIAATNSADATGTWVIYTLASAPGMLMSQPRLGNGTNAMLMAWDDFATPCSPGCTFKGDELQAIDRDELIAGSAPLDRVGPPPDPTRFAVMPVRMIGASGTEYFVWNNSDPTTLVNQTTSGPTLGSIAVQGQFNSSNHTNTITFNDWFFPTINPTAAPPNAAQPGGAPVLETGDDRLVSAIWENSKLWTAANEACPADSASACIRLLQLDTSNGNLTTSELGAAGDFVFDPGLTMNANGDLIASYMESNSTTNPRAVAATIGANAQAVVYGSGSAALNVGLCGLAPWQAYAGAAIDPANRADIWVAGAFGANTTDLCDWHTAIARLTLASPAITSFSPGTVPQAGGTVVDIKGKEFVPGTTVQFPSGAGTNVDVISPEELTAITRGSATSTAGAVSVTTPNGTAVSGGTMTTSPYQFSPSPIAPNSALGATGPATVVLTPQAATPAYLSFSGSGSACVDTCASNLSSTPTLYAPTSGQITIHYRAPASLSPGGTDVITVQNAASSPTASLTDSYTFGPSIAKVSFRGSPTIAQEGDLVAQTAVSLTLTATDASHNPVPNAGVSFTFTQAAGGGSASVNNVALVASTNWFTTDANGQIQVTYMTPDPLPSAGGTDTISASVSGVGDQDSYVLPPVTTFYFAEGFTAAGFTEVLSLLMPNESGTVLIDYYTQTNHGQSVAFLDQGMAEPVDVNTTVGANQQVSMKVTLPGPGIAERTLHFSFGSWHGSTDLVGVTAPSTVWNFAEGSTLSIFSEYLTIQNPNNTAVIVDLDYFRSDGVFAPSKPLNLPANSRTTVEVFRNAGSVPPGGFCVPNGAGANCGVGPSIGGVSVQVASRSLPVIAERPFYVNNFSFGSGPIRDGHDAFGATASSTSWSFAEGTTLPGFNEYLTLENQAPTTATVHLKYFTDIAGVNPLKTLTLPATSRTTVEVFNGDRLDNPDCTPGTGGTCGIGPGVGGVSLQVTASQAIVVERPMYMVHNFGTGSVAGAHVVVGATSLSALSGFSSASTSVGENDFLTIQNPASAVANLTLTYYTSTGAVVRNVAVAATSRHTVEVFKSAEGAGPGIALIGIVVQSDRPVLIEKPTYGSTLGAYGATDTLGYSPPGGSF